LYKRNITLVVVQYMATYQQGCDCQRPNDSTATCVILLTYIVQG